MWNDLQNVPSQPTLGGNLLLFRHSADIAVSMQTHPKTVNLQNFDMIGKTMTYMFRNCWDHPSPREFNEILQIFEIVFNVRLGFIVNKTHHPSVDNKYSHISC